MKVNIVKCKAMHIGTKNPKIQVSELAETERERDLEIVTDSSMEVLAQCTGAVK